MFSLRNLMRIARGVALHSNPLYVQFYITSRCNLTCQQCNIIYANSDVRECTLPEIERIAENLAEIGVAIVLLTGGEPFVRRDVPEIVRAFVRRGIHVRMQTNGLTSDEALARCVENGGRDISISLDSLQPEIQDAINGGFPNSWGKAIDAISRVTRHLPPAESFAAFGCVFGPRNIEDVEDVVRFGTAIGWYTSLVPIHVTQPHRPMNFRTYDQSLAFRPEHCARVEAMLNRLSRMKREGFLLYDSDEYSEDIRRFVRNEPIQWRRRNRQVCDSPSLYFAILPNGCFAVCCDHRLPGEPLPVYAPDFPRRFKSREFRTRVAAVAGQCPGCMFGSFPEITITARYWSAALERARVFLGKPSAKDWPVSPDRLREIAREILVARAGHAEPAEGETQETCPRTLR